MLRYLGTKKCYLCLFIYFFSLKLANLKIHAMKQYNKNAIKQFRYDRYLSC